MRVIDASSIVHAWDNYPILNFPTFWDWIDQEFSDDRLIIPSVALDEVGHVSPDCCDWLKDHSVHKSDVNAAIVRHAQQIKVSLGISNDRYGTGVDENDILIVATAKSIGHTLISNESKQPSLPRDLTKYKIPAVCNLHSVVCIDIADYIRQSGKVFG